MSRLILHRGHTLPAHPPTRPVDTTAPKLTRAEVLRRLWHFGPGVFALILAQAPNLDSVSNTAIACIVVVSLVVAALAVRHHDAYSRTDERKIWPAVFGYIVPIVVVLCLFPDYPELALMLIAIMAFGDGSATLFGLLYGSTRLPWNPEKTWVGTIAFVVAAMPVGALVYLFTADPVVSPSIAFLCAGTAAVCAAVVESLPLKGNDNFRVCTAAMAGVLIMHALLVGF